MRNKSLRFPVTFLLLFGAWLFFTSSLNVQELVAGVLVSLVIAYITKDFLFHKKPARVLNPVRWARFVAYFFVWLWLEIVANFDVAYRILTGRINPAIVNVHSKFKSDVGRTMIGNSITLTPGTLVVDIDGQDLYVHWINVASQDVEARTREIASKFEPMLRRIFE